MPRAYPQVSTPERYLAALGEHDPIESLRKAPKRLRKVLKGLSKKQLTRRSVEGKWSIKEVLAHLADGEVVLGARMRMVASMERPVLVGYDQDAFVRELRYDDVEPEQLLENFAAVRAINVAMLERLPDEVLARVGVHSERGDESLATMVFMYAGHDRLHEEQIERLKTESKAESKARGAANSKAEAGSDSTPKVADAVVEKKRKHGKRSKKGRKAKKELAAAR
jgi:hypothetical protein